MYGAWIQAGSLAGAPSPFDLSLLLCAAMVALSGERNLLTFKVSGIAFLAGLLHGSDTSVTVCAATFLAPSFCTLLSALASLTTPYFPGPYHVDVA
jgi:hypothetical protein